ncbi:MAG: hypothetical protein ABJA02_10570 [Acidobacteriota bacterium]
MASSRKTDFCKNEDCPSSQELLEYQTGDIERERGVDIRIHMGGCEFCAAEAEFYSRFPQISDDAEDEPSEIPEPLFELAQALLSDPHGKATALAARRLMSKSFPTKIF